MSFKFKALEFRENKSGVVILYTIVIGFIMVVVVLSIVALMVAELRFASRIDDSVRAFYAAESGAEYALRWLTDGGAKSSSARCRMANNTEGVFDNVAPPTAEVDWQNLTVQRRVFTSDGAPVDQVVRISVDGQSNEARRSVVIDVTPNCDFSSAAPGGDWVGTHGQLEEPI